MSYIGRFAPSPTGPLHLGSLVAALASYLDALVHDGRWLLRIDDADLSRVQPNAAEHIVGQLSHYGFVWHGEVTHTQQNQSQHAQALAQLKTQGKLYACACTRAQVKATGQLSSYGETVYSGQCRHLGLPHIAPTVRGVRLAVDVAQIEFTDRWQGAHSNALASSVGDFVLWRPEAVSSYSGGAYAYLLTMPVDDAAAGVTHVVRGADLLGVTARQIFIYQSLGLPQPSYLHVPLVTLPNGLKLSKQHGAPALPALDPIPYLNQAMQHLGLPAYTGAQLASFWSHAAAAWAQRLKQLPLISTVTVEPAAPAA